MTTMETSPDPPDEPEDLANTELLRQAVTFTDAQRFAIVEPLRGEAREKPMAKVEEVTPAKAEKWLRANVKNRDLRPSQVMKIAGDMMRGDYELTTDAIGFDANGLLTNGQHRLSAIVVSGATVPMIVARGLSVKAQDVTDQGLKRSLADTLKLRGENYVHLQQGALRWLHRLAYIEVSGSPFYANPSLYPTQTQLLQLWEAHPEMRELPRHVTRLHTLLPPVRMGVLMAIWYRLRQIDRDHADLFVMKLMSGDDLERTDPIFILRRVIMQDASRHHQKMPDWREAALIIKAWNLWRQGERIETLAYRFGPTQRERFPVPE